VVEDLAVEDHQIVGKMTLQEINNILESVTFNFYQHKFWWRTFEKGDGFLIQLCCRMVDNETGNMSDQHGGKHYISSFAIKDEVVNKAWNACQDFIIHEAREAFKYKGQAIYQPHWNVDELLVLTESSEPAKRHIM
jgi:hypothetical protein